MSEPRTSDRIVDPVLRSWLHEDRHEDVSRVAGTVLDLLDTTPQRRRPWWPARRFPVLNKFVYIGLSAAVVVVALVIGTRMLGPSTPSGVGGTASASPSPSPSPTASPTPTPIPIGGTIQFELDGAKATTVVDAVADGTSVSGTAVTTSAAGTHTVRLECAARQGDRWAFVGTTETSTFPDEGTGAWSAVVVEDGTPQKVGIVFGIDKAVGDDCHAKWQTISMADMGVSNPVESGELVPPPALAP